MKSDPVQKRLTVLRIGGETLERCFGGLVFAFHQLPSRLLVTRLERCGVVRALRTLPVAPERSQPSASASCTRRRAANAKTRTTTAPIHGARDARFVVAPIVRTSRGLEIVDQFAIGRVTIRCGGREHLVDHACRLARNVRRDCLQIRRILFQAPQLRCGSRFAFDRRSSGDRVEERRAEAVDVAAEILRLVV